MDKILHQVAWLSREIEKLRRVVVCNPEDQYRIQEALDLTLYGDLYTVQASMVTPKGTIYLVDPRQMHVAISMPPVDVLFAEQEYQDAWKKLLVDYTALRHEDRVLSTHTAGEDVVGECSACAWRMTSFSTSETSPVDLAFSVHDCRSFEPKEDA